MAIRTCSKLRNGSMSYDFDEETRNIRLDEDLPETGEQGAWFDSTTKVSFDAINAILKNKPAVGTRDFVNLFGKNLANNGPMLVAALLNEGKLAKSNHAYNVRSTL